MVYRQAGRDIHTIHPDRVKALQAAKEKNWELAIEHADSHPSRIRIRKALQDTVETKRLTFLVAPYQTGKNAIVQKTFPGIRWREPKLEEIADGVDVPKIYFHDEPYLNFATPAEGEKFTELVGKAAEKTRIIICVHPFALLDGTYWWGDEPTAANPGFEGNLYGRAVKPLLDLEPAFVEGGFWTDELCFDVAKIMGLTDDEAMEAVRVSGGMPLVLYHITAEEYGLELSNLDCIFLDAAVHLEKAPIEFWDACGPILESGKMGDGELFRVLKHFEYIRGEPEDCHIRSTILAWYAAGEIKLDFDPELARIILR